MTYRSENTMRPLLIFDGNCQAHHLAAIFESSGLAETYSIGDDYGFVPSYQGVTTKYCTIDEAMIYVRQAKTLKRPVYQISQSTQMQDASHHDYRSLVDGVIKFPFLQYYCIVPERFQSIYKNRRSPKQILDFDLSLMRLCQEKAESSIDYVSFVRQEGKRTLLFNTENHPRGILVAQMFLDVATQLPFLDKKIVADVAIDLDNSEGINHVTVHPISSEVREMLDFRWGDDYVLLVEILNARSHANWVDVMRLCASAPNFWNDSQLLMAFNQACMAINDLENKGDYFFRLTQLLPGFVHSWLLRYQYWQRLNDESEMRQCRIEVRRALRGSRYYSMTRGWMEIQDGCFDESLNYGIDYLQRTPDRADGIVLYTKSLCLLGRHDEAKKIFYEFAMNRGISDLGNVISQLDNLPELGIDVEDLRNAVTNNQ